jgi:hypothetical protein
MENNVMSFSDHFNELKSRLIKILVVFAIV